MSKPAWPAGAVDSARAYVETPAGAWQLGWDPRLGSFQATHWREAAAGTRDDYRLGVTAAAIPTVGALEECLGFCLPLSLLDALAMDQATRPALATSRYAVVPEAERLRDADTYPEWGSWAEAVDGGGPFRWGARLESERSSYLRSFDFGAGARLDVLNATSDAPTASLRVAYRLTDGARPIFSADDISAPADANVVADESLRALIGVLIDPDPSHRARPLTLAQERFLADHGPRLADAAAVPAPPYPPGTRIAVATSAHTRHTGVVAWPICDRKDAVAAYAWRPDVAALPGHPWRLHPDHHLVSPAEHITASLASPDSGQADPSRLAFGAIIAFPHPETGMRTEATVLRAIEDGGRVGYQVQPHPDDEPLTVDAENMTLITGTWWPTVAALRVARADAGIPILPGERLTALDASPRLGVVGDHRATPLATRVQGQAALMVDTGRRPTVLRLDVHGTLTRVGDPQHGWLVVPTDPLLAGLTVPPDSLRRLLAASNVALTGDEPHPTLAALAARHAPEGLPSPPAIHHRPRAATPTIGAGL